MLEPYVSKGTCTVLRGVGDSNITLLPDNLDDNVLEVYEGFQKTPDENRYKINEPDNGYYHVKLVKTYPLDSIPKNWTEDFNEEE